MKSEAWNDEREFLCHLCHFFPIRFGSSVHDHPIHGQSANRGQNLGQMRMERGVLQMIMSVQVSVHQKWRSLTWERMSEPEPVARTSSSRFTVVSFWISGATIPAPVMVATVAEPVATRTTAAAVQANTSGERCACAAH